MSHYKQKNKFLQSSKSQKILPFSYFLYILHFFSLTQVFSEVLKKKMTDRKVYSFEKLSLAIIDFFAVISYFKTELSL